MNSPKYFVVYKPFQVLCQFSPQEDKQTLKHFFKVPTDVYPIGRLDFDSEGLLILSNDSTLNHKLLNPAFAHKRSYWVQVDGAITEEAVVQLQKGVTISVSGKRYQTKKCEVAIFKLPPIVPDRNPPIRFRKEIPAPWVKITLTEGKNRQVRRMFAAVGFPVLRLIRAGIENLLIDKLQPGDLIELDKKAIFNKLHLLN